MARFIPVRSQCQFDTPGERRSVLGVASVARVFAGEAHCEGHWQELNCLVTHIRGELANGRALSDMAIIYRSSSQAQAAEHALTQMGIGYASGANSKACSDSTAATTA